MAKLNTMSIGDSLTGVVTQSSGRLYWGITRLTQVRYEVVLTHTSQTAQFGEFTPNKSNDNIYTIRQLVGMDNTGVLSMAGITKAVMAA
ncbi:MAG: hypothetical protein HN929_12635 [Chloroflexi bacterium]|nr:hypothetical protein [Chloroflexota bacterium]